MINEVIDPRHVTVTSYSLH